MFAERTRTVWFVCRAVADRSVGSQNGERRMAGRFEQRKNQNTLWSDARELADAFDGSEVAQVEWGERSRRPRVMFVRRAW